MSHYAKMDKADTINFVEIALMSAQLDFFVGKCWVLRSIKGESAGEEGHFPTEPDPRWGPESVVCGQLEALRDGDVERALRFVSLPDEEAAGSVQHSSLVHHIPAYAPLLYHNGYSVAATAQVSADKSVIFVGVHGQRSLEGKVHDQYTLPYMWFLSLQQTNTWMIYSVQHVAGS
ncbi:hypothetical protein WJX75_000505 [Coccomyxa subellipsoidea]|uniref:Uncharacterized protein n=1 Tax=Coccomyxa subellipsoidea TaxID=248742 RepID=A0ABR2YRW2_9CHLO